MPPNSGNEAARLAALRDLDILDTEPEAEFESIVKAAAALCGMPMSLISLVDEDRQWFKANVGLPGTTETPRSMAFCARTILQDDIMEVDDCAKDARFQDNPLVTGTPELRFYAGVPLCLSDGSHVGSLCVLDQKPGKLTDSQRIALTHLSEAAVHALESRRTARNQVINESRFRTLCSSLSVGVFATDTQGNHFFANERLRQILGVGMGEVSVNEYLRNLHPHDKELFANHWREATESDSEFELEFRILRDDNTVITARILSSPVLSNEDSIIGRVGSVEDVTLSTEHLTEQYRILALLRQTGSLAKVGGWELDVSNEKVTWTEQTCLIHGLPTDYQPVLSEALNYYTPESREKLTASLNKLSMGGSSFDLEVQLQRVDGQCIWVRVVGEADLEEGKVARLRGAVQDIDEVVRQRMALKNAHERISMATESADIGVWEWDFESDDITCTELLLDLYGLPLSENVLKIDKWKEMLHPDDRFRAWGNLQHALKGEGNYEGEFRIVRPDGEIRQIHGRAAIQRDEAGRPLKLYGVNMDVTTVRQLTTQLEQRMHSMLLPWPASW